MSGPSQEQLKSLTSAPATFLFTSTGTPGWRQRIAHSDKQWKKKFAATSLAIAWGKQNGFPPRVAEVLEQNQEPFASMIPLLMVAEHRVAVPRQNLCIATDLWVLSRHRCGFGSLAVEGTVSGVLGPTIAEWKKRQTSRKRQLQLLSEIIGFPGDPPGTLRYRFLECSACALFEADRFRADTALVVFHSFAENARGFAHYQEFTSIWGATPGINSIVRLCRVAETTLYCVWIRTLSRKQANLDLSADDKC